MDIEELDEQPNEGLTRRQVLTRIGVGAAVVWAAPIVTSIGTPAFAASVACQCAGDQCSGQTACGNGCACSQVHGKPGACFCDVITDCTNPLCSDGCPPGTICLDTCCAEPRCFVACGTQKGQKIQKGQIRSAYV